MRRQGFSLIELLIVIAVIAIIAALAVPNLISSRKAANEAAAIAHLRTWTTAQELYFNLNSAYATSEDQLLAFGLVGNPDPVGLGYIYAIQNAAGYEWEGTASPTDPGISGDRYFFIDNTGVIRWSTGGPADASSMPLGAPTP